MNTTLTTEICTIFALKCDSHASFVATQHFWLICPAIFNAPRSDGRLYGSGCYGEHLERGAVRVYRSFPLGGLTRRCNRRHGHRLPGQTARGRVENLLQNARHLEERSVFDTRDVRAEILESAQELPDGSVDVTKARVHDTQSVRADPLSVVALLGHGPGVIDHDHGQALLHGLAGAAGPGLTDEEVGQLHIGEMLPLNAICRYVAVYRLIAD